MTYTATAYPPQRDSGSGGSQAAYSYSGVDRGYSYTSSYDGYEPGPSTLQRTPSAVLRDIANYTPPDPRDEDDELWEEPDEIGADEFINCALLSHLAVHLRDKVPRGTHVKGSIPYTGAFTGKDIVVSGTELTDGISLSFPPSLRYKPRYSVNLSSTITCPQMIDG